MTKYEELLADFEEECDISEQVMECHGLYCDSTIWIKKDLTQSEKLCVLAEELGHHLTSYGDILDQNDVANIKQERLARRTGYKFVIDINKVYEACQKGITEIWEIAEYLDVPEWYLREYLALGQSARD